MDEDPTRHREEPSESDDEANAHLRSAARHQHHAALLARYGASRAANIERDHAREDLEAAEAAHSDDAVDAAAS